MENNPNRTGFSTPFKIIVVVAALLILIAWLQFTPSGILGKADAIGYAVCHRIPSHSFFFDIRAMPLCARCSGMHLGVLLGLLFQLRYGKRGGMPAKKIMIVLGIFLLAFGLDGINSYLTLGKEGGNSIPILSSIPILYTPQNWLRLLTGTMLGVGIAAVLLPVFNQTMWVDWSEEPALSSWRQLGILILLALVVDLAVLSENILVLFPLALLSSLDVLIILSLVYTIVWVMILKRENAYMNLKELWVPLVAGFALAVLQIAIMDYGRYMLTGTWDGFFS
jgi:uncharacterized membrane protein